MSNTRLMNWLETLLFGSKYIPENVPCELQNILLKMEADNIPWEYIILNGGFTMFPHQIYGDLNILIDHLSKNVLSISLQTQAVTKFWNELQLLLARQREKDPQKALPVENDDKILKDLLTTSKAATSYQSASFWGDIARRFINLNRPPVKDIIHPMPEASSENLKRSMKLYTITCQSRGEYWDPFTMHLVPHSEYVNACYWQSDQILETFMKSNPNHSLTQSIQKLLVRVLNQFFYAEKPTALLNSWPELDALLHNIQVIHNKIEQVPHENEPPKLVDVFQRLLALSFQDNLWESNVILKEKPNKVSTGMDLFVLTEQLRVAERQNRLMWKLIDIEENVSKPHGNICS